MLVVMKRLAAALTIAVLASCSGGPDRPATAPTGGEPVDRLPNPIPAMGVNVHGDFTVVPDPTALPGVSREQAIAVAHQYSNVEGSVVVAQLGRVTIPSSLPPVSSPVPYDSVEDELCWVVAFEFPAAIDVHVGGTTPAYASRHYVILDATTAQMRRGIFET